MKVRAFLIGRSHGEKLLSLIKVKRCCILKIFPSSLPTYWRSEVLKEWEQWIISFYIVWLWKKLLSLPWVAWTMPNGVDHLFCQWKAENLTKNSTKLDVLLTFLMWTIRLQSVFSLKTENNQKKKNRKRFVST